MNQFIFLAMVGVSFMLSAGFILFLESL